MKKRRLVRDEETHILIICPEGHNEWIKLASYLKRKAFVVLSVSALGRAFQLLRSEPVKIVLSDFSHQNIKTPHFLKRMHDIKPSVQVIFLSEKATLSTAIQAMRDGAYDFYEFPVNKRLLHTVIEKAIEKEELFIEKRELQRKIMERFYFGNIVGRSKSIRHVIERVSSVASKNVNVLISGETGTGKEMIANAIHYNSPRVSSPFIKVNCAALSESLLESELFGHEKGAFTGAITRRIGRFELAHEGTLFIDEVGDLPPGTQIKLLRVLQEKEFERVGGNAPIRIDARIIAATNQDLTRLISERRFREDLYYRLNVVNIQMPPLRERKEDIPLLVSAFIQKFHEEKGYSANVISKTSMQVLLNYRWPGNVRELENAIESAMALSEKNVIEAKYLPSFLLLTEPKDTDFYQVSRNLTLREIEREVIRFALDKTDGNKTRASKMLGIGLRTLQRKAKEL